MQCTQVLYVHMCSRPVMQVPPFRAPHTPRNPTWHRQARDTASNPIDLKSFHSSSSHLALQRRESLPLGARRLWPRSVSRRRGWCTRVCDFASRRHQQEQRQCGAQHQIFPRGIIEPQTSCFRSLKELENPSRSRSVAEAGASHRDTEPG